VISYNFLIVDDEPDFIEIIEFHLDAMYPKSKIITTTLPLEALEITKSNEFDVIFTDFKMPLMNGVDLIKSIRSDDNPNKGVGVIMITGKRDMAEMSLSELPYTLIHDKPFDQDKLKANIKLFISLKS
jgi:CheY-like chemotaxis protein